MLQSKIFGSLLENYTFLGTSLIRKMRMRTIRIIVIFNTFPFTNTMLGWVTTLNTGLKGGGGGGELVEDMISVWGWSFLPMRVQSEATFLTRIVVPSFGTLQIFALQITFMFYEMDYVFSVLSIPYVVQQTNCYKYIIYVKVNYFSNCYKKIL